MAAMEWNGRPVVLAEFNIRRGRVVREAFALDGEQGSYTCLVESLRWADSGEPVFQSVDEVLDQPFRLQQRLLRLASAAAKLNGMLDDDDAGERTTNGSGVSAEGGTGPSL